MTRSLAVVTGGSSGLGRASALALAERGWSVLADARDGSALRAALGSAQGVVLVPGDVTAAAHRDEIARIAADLGGTKLLVNNASTMGAVPLPSLARYPARALRDALETNVVAPLLLTQALLPQLRAHRGTIVGVSSDAACEPYAGWGGYGATKAGLDLLGAVLAVEEPELHVYAFDPGDMRTPLRASALPDEDVDDLPPPEAAVPALLRLVAGTLPSGRYTRAELEAAPLASQTAVGA